MSTLNYRVLVKCYIKKLRCQLPDVSCAWELASLLSQTLKEGRCLPAFAADAKGRKLQRWTRLRSESMTRATSLFPGPNSFSEGVLVRPCTAHSFKPYKASTPSFA